MKTYTIATQKELRNCFWIDFPQFIPERRGNKKQKDYCCDIRCAFVDYVDAMQKDGVISESLANRATL